MRIRSLAVFCGSKQGSDPLFAEHAAELGGLMASQQIAMIYGGGSTGLMGIVANAVMNGNGRVTGIIPHILVEWEHQHRGITELVVADDMHERKKTPVAFMIICLRTSTGSLKQISFMNPRVSASSYSVSRKN
jgi:hypothetical protein